ncbi:MAG: PQQ-dependent sugar dehydrogenase [Hyphomicrobiales bacterium]|nr:PQQ-dependent sugar dehydrogenase [Hyphomicrobiales bacterium]
MQPSTKLKTSALTIVAATAAVAVAGFLFTSGAKTEELKHYDSNNKQFWTHPPDDWFMGDETKELHGTNYLKTLPPATGFTKEEIEAKLKHIKLPPGFKIELYASGVTDARQMAWGDKGTLFVGSLFGGGGTVHAVVDEGGKRVVKDAIKGLKFPSGIAFRNGALYVADVNKIYKYENAEDHIGSEPAPQIVYDDMPPYIPHGWKYLAFDKKGWLYVAFGPPCNICLPPTTTAQVRHINPENGTAEIVALGVRNSVGGDVDPRTDRYWFTENARDWLGEDIPSDKLEYVSHIGVDFGYPYCHEGDIPDPKFAMGHKCSEFTPPAFKLGAHVAPLGMKFYSGNQFPAEYKNSIIVAEHGSWNRLKYQGARLVRINVDPDGKNAKQEVFASGWLGADNKYLGRPSDVIVAKDGSLLVADDFNGAIYRISYSK